MGENCGGIDILIALLFSLRFSTEGSISYRSQLKKLISKVLKRE